MQDRPDAPYVELGFYAADRPEDEFMQDILDCLSARGARPNGRGYVHSAQDSASAFESPTDFDRYEVVIGQLARVAEGVPGEQRLVEVEVAGAFRYDPAHCARVTYLAVDPAHVEVDNHPIAIWASGDAFSHPPGKPPPEQDLVAAELREVFTAIVNSTSPSYGAITVEWPLKSPRDIAVESGYSDFFVNRSYLGDASLARIEAAATGLDVVRTAVGLFVFSDSIVAGEAFAREIAARSVT